MQDTESGGSPGDSRNTAAAAAVQVALGNPAQGEEARDFLREQTWLVRLQIADIERENRLRHWSLRFGNVSAVMKVAFEIALAFIFVAIAAGIGTSIWTAAHDNSLIIESFTVPPDMANRGLTGQAVAAQLEDRLAVMQDATDSARPANSYRNNWGDDIKVQIPDTGISIGELYRILTGWLGHQTHITGEVYRTQDGISVSARAGGGGGTIISGPESDFAKLLQQTAEAVYARTQPYRYAAFVTGNGPTANSDKGVAILKRLTLSPDPVERAWALLGLGNWQLIIGDFTGALKNEIASATLDPSLVGNTDAAWGEMLLGHDEGALTWFVRTLHQEWHVDPGVVESLKAFDRAYYSLYSNDFLAAERAFAEVETLPNYTGFATIAPAQRAESLALAHDVTGAHAILAEHGWKNDAAINPLAVNSFVDCPPFFEIDAAIGDWSAAIADLKQVETGKSAKLPVGHQIWLVFDLPMLAYATAMSGATARAEALIAKTPTDCYLCVRVRARIATAERNWPQAEHWFAEAVRQGPSLPSAETEWGSALLEKGDAAGAIAKLEAASRKGPHFADPLEMWGEALMLKNRSDLALAKFEEANKYVPNWGRLHLEWGEALMYAGNRTEALKQFTTAAHLDLSPPDNAALTAWMAAHG